MTSKKNLGNDESFAPKMVLEKTLLLKNWPLPAKKSWWNESSECNEHGEPGEYHRKICKVCHKSSWFVHVTTGRNFYRMSTLTSNTHK